MTPIVLTVVVIALLIATRAIFLNAVGVFLNRTADNLGECLNSVEKIVSEAAKIGPGVKRINGGGGALVDARDQAAEVCDRTASVTNIPSTWRPSWSSSVHRQPYAGPRARSTSPARRDCGASAGAVGYALSGGCAGGVMGLALCP
jgi:hypothetical protein